MISRIASGTAIALACMLLAGPAASATVPAAPNRVTAKPAATGVSVHWARTPGHPTYTVTSTPPGKGCTTTASSCTIPVEDTTPWTFSVTASVGGSTSAPSTPTAPIPTRRVVVVAGASNAAGFESYALDPTTRTNYFAPPLASPADRLSTIAWLPWLTDPAPRVVPMPLRTPQRITTTTPVTGGRQIFGPELGLARQLFADTGQATTVVKVAVPANLYKFWKGNGDPKDAVTHTADLVRQVMAYEATKHRLAVLSGVFWVQGESDTDTALWAGAYERRLTELIASFHAALPLAPNAPFVIAKISTVLWWQNLAAVSACPNGGSDCAEQLAADATVRAAEDAVAAADPTVTTGDTADLPRVGVGLHLSNEAELALGQRMAVAAEAMLP